MQKVIISKLTKEQFLDFYNGANSVTEILRRMNKATTGSAFKIVKKYCLIHDLPIPVCSPNIQTENATNTHSFKLEDILIDGIHYKSARLKNRLVDAGIMLNECSICKISTWQGKPITLQLDHINGKNTDNRLINLRILCPNCHSQTDTFGNKKRT